MRRLFLNIHDLTISEIKALLSNNAVSEQLLNAMKHDNRKGIQKLIIKYNRTQEFLLKKKEHAEKLLQYEKKLWLQGYTYIGGIDEAGRGPLAGPVVSACVILPRELIIEGIDDSKKLTVSKRLELFDKIYQNAYAVGIGIVENKRIDKINIYKATIESMMKAVLACRQKPDFLLLDAMHLNDLPLPQLSLIKGDSKSQSIAAASIIAKVTRDKIMENYAKLYPQYGFEKHKGYGTKEHINAIIKYGVSPIHRQSFLNKILSMM